MSGQIKELGEIEDRFGEKAVDEVRRAANLLLRQQFLFAGDRGSTHAYEIVTGRRHRAYFEALFDALGYILRVNEVEQWISLLPDAELDLFPKMKAEHTIVLLVLALTWQEEINRGGAEARAVVASSLNGLFERYRDVTARGRKETLSTARFEEALKEFQRRGLVNIGPVDPELNDKQVDIRPMVHLLVDGTALDRLDRFAAEAEGASNRARRAQGSIDEDDGEQGDEQEDRT